MVEFIWVDKLTEPQIEQLIDLYRKEWWTNRRSEPDIRKMIERATHLFPLVDRTNNRLIAFARVITDHVFKALIFDVIVDSEYRGLGLGREMMDRIVTHPDLEDVKQFELYCLPEMIPFYERWGFTEKLGSLTFMRRTQP